jgi:tetratricopeptide (TPR) repeat protein
MCFLAETAARLGERDHAATLYALLLPYVDRVAISYPEISLGPVSRFLGLLAAATARWNDAERHFEDALQLSERIGARTSLAHAQDDYAQMLLERGEHGDAAKARDFLNRASTVRSELGVLANAPTATADVVASERA